MGIDVKTLCRKIEALLNYYIQCHPKCDANKIMEAYAVFRDVLIEEANQQKG